MSVVVAEGVVQVTADGKDIPRQISRDIDGAARDVEGGGRSLGLGIATGVGRGLMGIGVATGVAIGAATAAVAAGVGAIIVNGVKFDASMQNYTAAFTPLLGGADAAKAKLGELSAFAAATPFTIDGLAHASQTLLAFGTTNADLLPDLKMLGNISQGNQEKLSGLSLVFGQVQSNGHLMGQDLLQMINQGFNPLQIISDKTGESMSSLRDRMAAGGISFQEVKDAMVSATSAGGMFFGSMDLGAKTLTGAWSSTGDGARILSGAMVSSLTPALTGVLNDGINPLLGGLVGLVNGTAGAQATVDSASTALLGQVSKLGPALVGVLGNVGKVFTAIAPALGSAFASIVTGLVSILPSLLAVAGQLVMSIVRAIAGSAPQLVQAAVPLILNLAAGIVGMLPMLIQTGVDVLLALVTGITASLPTLIPGVVTAVIGAIVTLFAPGNLTALLDAGLSLITGLVTGLIAALPTLIAALPGIIVGIITFLINAIPTLIDAGLKLFLALVGALPDIILGIVNALPQIIIGIITAVIGAIPKLISAGIKLFIGLIGALPQIIVALVNAVPQIITGLVKAFGDPKTIGMLAKAGGDLIRGLWQGMSDLSGWIISKIAGFASGIVKSIKGFFGIHSPSTVFRDEVGGMLGAGLAEGILGSQGIVSAAAAQLGASAQVTVAGSAGVGVSGSAPSSFGAVGGGMVVNIDSVTLDATNVRDFTDVVAMIAALPQVARGGRGSGNNGGLAAAG